MRQMETVFGILIPFLGTTLGAACVFFMKRSLGDLVRPCGLCRRGDGRRGDLEPADSSH